MMRALTSTDDAEIVVALRTLRNTTAGTYFMHEAFQMDDPAKYTRPWFAWANTLFGELVLKLPPRTSRAAAPAARASQRLVVPSASKLAL